MTAASAISSRFVHRSNRNGTTDSICKECFCTVATSLWEAELERKEGAHACDPWTVERFRKMVKREVRPAVLHWQATA